MKTSKNSLSELVPDTVIQNLTEAELAEAEAIFEAYKHTDSIPLPLLRSSNLALSYLLLNHPLLKYSLLKELELPEAKLVQLLEFDASHLDAYHEFMEASFLEESAQWRQSFNTLLAVMGNKNFTGTLTKKFFEELVLTGPYDELELSDLISSQLRDKWTPKEFNSSVLGYLCELFELNGTYELAQFKRWYRRALKKEDSR